MGKIYSKLLVPLVGLVAVSAAGIITAKDVDVVVVNRTKEGTTERIVVPSSQVKALRENLVQGGTLSKLRKAKPNLFHSPVPDMDQKDGFMVRFAVEPEEDSEYTWTPSKVYVTHGDGDFDGDYYYSWYMGPDEEWGCRVPEGVYDVILSCGREKGESSYVFAYVVKENVEIKEDMTVTFKMSDAKNLLSSEMKFADGRVMEYPQSILDGNDGTNEERVGFSFFRCINHKEGSFCMNMVGMGSPRDSVLVNDLSDKWTYAINHVGVDVNGSYVNKLVVPGPFTSDRSFTNEPADYVRTTATFEPVENTNLGVKGHGASTQMTWKGADWNAGAGVAVIFDGEYDGINNLYLNIPPSDMSAETGYDVLVAPAILESKIVDMEEVAYLTANGPGMFPTKDGRYTFVDPNGLYVDEEHPGVDFYLPVISPFAFEGDAEIYFRFAPLTVGEVLYCEYMEFWGKTMLNVFFDTTYPMFEQWLLPQTLTMKYDGQTILLGEDKRVFDWCIENEFVPGLVEISANSVWKTIGGRKLNTASVVKLDASKPSFNPPVVNIYQLRDGDNRLRNTLSPDGKVVFAVSDVDNDLASVRVQVSELDSDEWTDLTCENISENDSPTSYGKYYEASLASLSNDSDTDVTYSLRFLCQDVEGNSSVSTIEGVFDLKGGESRVGSVGQSRINVGVVGHDIIAPVGASVYNLQGTKVGTNNLPTGIYLVHFDGHTVKVAVR